MHIPCIFIYSSNFIYAGAKGFFYPFIFGHVWNADPKKGCVSLIIHISYPLIYYISIDYPYNISNLYYPLYVPLIILTHTSFNRYRCRMCFTVALGILFNLELKDESCVAARVGMFHEDIVHVTDVRILCICMYLHYVYT